MSAAGQRDARLDRSEERELPLGRLLTVASLAGLGAAAINSTLFLVGSAIGAMPTTAVVPGRGAITLGAVISTSFVPALVAAVLLALLRRLTRHSLGILLGVAVMVLIVSLAMPFALVGASVAMRAILLLMHVVAAIVILGSLVRVVHLGQ